MINDTIGLTFSIWDRFYKCLKPAIIRRQLTEDWRQTMICIALEINPNDTIKTASRQIGRQIYHKFLKPYGFTHDENLISLQEVEHER